MPGLTQIWFLEPDIAYSFPNDDDQTLLLVAPAQARLEAWKRDIETNFINLFESLPLRGDPRRQTHRPLPRNAAVAKPAAATCGDTGPGLDRGCRTGGRSPLGRRLRLGSPVRRMACRLTAEALRNGGDLDAPLAAYRRQHRRQLAGHAFLIADFASGRGFNPIEKLMFSAAARDPVCAAHVMAFSGRTIECFPVSFSVCPGAGGGRQYRSPGRSRDDAPPAAGT